MNSYLTGQTSSISIPFPLTVWAVLGLTGARLVHTNTPLALASFFTISFLKEVNYMLCKSETITVDHLSGLAKRTVFKKRHS